MKRVWIGSLLIAAGVVLALLPLHILMTGLCLIGYGVLCLAAVSYTPLWETGGDWRLCWGSL